MDPTHDYDPLDDYDAEYYNDGAVDHDRYANDRAIHNYEHRAAIDKYRADEQHRKRAAIDDHRAAEQHATAQWAEWAEWHIANDPHPYSSYYSDPFAAV